MKLKQFGSNDRQFTTAAVGLALLTTVGCSSHDAANRVSPIDGRPTVLTVNYPLMYFAERIGGDHIDVRFPAPAHIDPAFWNPSADELAAYQAARLILLNGGGYANWIQTASLPTSRVVDTSQAFRSKLIAVTTDATTHRHGPSGEHSHAGTAFTTWIDFDLAAQQAEGVRDALIRLAPERADEFELNFGRLQADLLQLDRAMSALAAQIGDRPLIVSHPVYQYWSRRYGLNVKAVHWEPDGVPAAAELSELEELLAAHAADWMIWEAEPSIAAVQRLSALGIGSVVFAPCANDPHEGDWLSVMKQNLVSCQSILGGSTPSTNPTALSL